MAAVVLVRFGVVLEHTHSAKSVNLFIYELVYIYPVWQRPCNSTVMSAAYEMQLYGDTQRDRSVSKL